MSEYRRLTAEAGDVLRQFRERIAAVAVEQRIGQEARGAARSVKDELTRVVDDWLDEGWYPVLVPHEARGS